MLPTEPNTPPDSRVWRLIHFPPVTLALGFVFYLGAGFVATWVSRGIPQAHNVPVELALVLVVLALFVAGYAAFVLWIERRPLAEFAPAGALRELGVGLLAGVVLFSVVLGVIALCGGYRVIGTNAPAVLYPAASLSIVAAVSEEIALRGLFFRIVERWLGSWIALVLSAALFGALHLGNPDASLRAAVAIMLEAGVMLVALYMVTRRLWAVIGLHAAWNFTQGGIYGFSVSGYAQSGLLRARIAGRDWLTGGTFGAEASLPAVVVCTGFGVALLAVAVRNGRVVAPVWARARAR